MDGTRPVLTDDKMSTLKPAASETKAEDQEPSSAQMITFGCRLNSYESEIMRELSMKESPSGQTATIIVNTCAVTAEAERQARQAIRRARREHPEAHIIVTGCAAQIAPERYAEMEEVDRVLGNIEKLKAESYDPQGPRLQVTDIMDLKETAGHFLKDEPPLERFAGRSRAFLQVQNGCDHRCTFCIIPYGRGNSRSVPLGPILDQATRLVENGYQEIVLTGVDLTDYGADLPGTPSLGKTVERLLKALPDLARLRLSSIDVAEIDPVLERLILEDPRMMPYLHLSLQSGDDLILKRMKRRHNCAQVRAFCQKVMQERPEMVFGADFIAGFPTETDEMAANTLELVEACHIMHLHIFPYSDREGTPAAKMPTVPKPVRQQRASELRALGARLLRQEMETRCDQAQKEGRLASVLLERIVEADGVGRDESFLPVRLPNLQGTDIQSGALLSVRYEGVDQKDLIGHIEAIIR